MPATSSESLLAWGVYLLASGGLLAVLVPTLGGVQEKASLDHARTAVDGLAQVVDGLRPGTVVVLDPGSTGANGNISLSGSTVTMESKAGEVSAHCDVALPAMTLVPGREYALAVEGDSVSVTQIGAG